MWNASDIAGLTYLGAQRFSYRYNRIALSGGGTPIDAPVSASFRYDDKAFGMVPDGVLKTLGTCAVNMGGVTTSGEYVQLLVGTVARLGSDASGLTTINEGGQITAFTAAMEGIGSIDCADANSSRTADHLVTIATELPLSVSFNGPFVLLLRPTALTWSGQAANDANRTIWKLSEVRPATFQFGVTSQSVEVQMDFRANGFQ